MSKGATAKTPFSPSPAPQQQTLAKVTPEILSEIENLVSFPDCRGCLSRDIALRLEGETRSFHLYIPTGAAKKTVMVTHGNGASADQVVGVGVAVSPLKLWLEIAEREGLLIIVPNGTLGATGSRGWNDCRADAVGNPKANDVAFLTTLTALIAKRYGTSANFVTGMSNGGLMAMRLATETPELYKGIGVIAAGVSAKSQCVPKNQPISVLLLRGTDDPISPFGGGKMAANRGTVLSMEESLKVFLSWNGISQSSVTEAVPDLSSIDNSNVTRVSYPISPSKTQVEGYIVNGGGHTEPSLKELYSPVIKANVGEQNRDVESAELVWRFFQKL